MKIKVCIFIVFSLVFSLCSCVFEESKSESFTFKDDLGQSITLTESDRVAACHASFGELWLLAGGELVGVTSDAASEHGLKTNADIIGTAKDINLEALVKSGATAALLSSDLTAHLELKSSLEALSIKCIYFKVDTFEDYASVMERLCGVSGRDDLYYLNVTLVAEKIGKILEKVPKNETRSVLLMRAYSSGIKAKSDDNLAGMILKEYGLLNIADRYPSLLEDISLEYIVETDPDFIFVLTMGNEEAARRYLYENIEKNPAFASTSAVKDGNYHILPKNLFHYKPNERWDESYEYLAKILYPELFPAH